MELYDDFRDCTIFMIDTWTIESSGKLLCSSNSFYEIHFIFLFIFSTRVKSEVYTFCQQRVQPTSLILIIVRNNHVRVYS